MKKLCPVHVAHAGDHRLVHEHCANRHLRSRDVREEGPRISVLTKGVLSEAIEDGAFLSLRDELARRRASQVDGDLRPFKTHTNGWRGSLRRRRALAELPKKSEVHVDGAGTLEALEEMLSVGFDPSKGRALARAEQCVDVEAALGRRHAEGAAA